MNTRRLLLDHLHRKFPALALERLESLAAETLVSNQVLKLPHAVWMQATDFVRACHELRHSSRYARTLERETQDRHLIDPGHDSIAMSYDFHLDESGTLKLIEINTNASFLALGDELYEAQNLAKPNPEFSSRAFEACVRRELSAVLGPGAPLKAAIVDEAPEAQKLFLEFLVYEQWFKSWGWDVAVRDSALDPSGFSFIYNRDTDFYLETERLAHLRRAWVQKTAALSPHPYQYLLLADKQRQIDWAVPGFFESIGLSEDSVRALRRHLPRVFDLNAESAETLWAQRKSLFIKPKRSFGAKQSYRGGSISRKMFEELIPQDMIAQEFIPAPELKFDVNGTPTSMKYDLRFYAYGDEVQTVMARLYQGQVTNLRTEGGGFTAISFEGLPRS